MKGLRYSGSKASTPSKISGSGARETRVPVSEGISKLALTSPFQTGKPSLTSPTTSGPATLIPFLKAM